MDRFNEDFRTKLYDTIKKIEDNSLVEIVVIIKPSSGKYRDIPVWSGVVFASLLYTFFMFSHIEFNVYLIYVFTILSFFLAWSLVAATGFVQKLFVKKERKHRNVEINARAIFQKGGIRFTQERIGTLFYVSLLEKMVYILPDRGAENAIPAEEWQNMHDDFQKIFSAGNIADELIVRLNKWQPIFSKYIPPVENDVNELPDNMDVNL
jgi:putative membrane protein